MRPANQQQLGGVTCLWSFVIWFLLPDSPSSAWFFNQRERLVAVKRVAGNETGIKNKAFDKKQVSVALTDPKAILLFISVFAAYVPPIVYVTIRRLCTDSAQRDPQRRCQFFLHHHYP